LSDQVETYAGHRLHERPLRFQLKGTWHRVVQVLSRWHEPGHLCFTVSADDGRHYLLKYSQETDVWEVSISLGRKPDPSSL